MTCVCVCVHWELQMRKRYRETMQLPDVEDGMHAPLPPPAPRITTLTRAPRTLLTWSPDTAAETARRSGPRRSKGRSSAAEGIVKPGTRSDDLELATVDADDTELLETGEKSYRASFSREKASAEHESATRHTTAGAFYEQ